MSGLSMCCVGECGTLTWSFDPDVIDCVMSDVEASRTGVFETTVWISVCHVLVVSAACSICWVDGRVVCNMSTDGG